MAPGDLNLKKSWNPKLMKNRKKVWEREQEALEERKKIKERQEEIKKEREKQELRNLMLKKTTAKTSITTDRIDWMYEQTNTSKKKGNSESKDEHANDDDNDYLLGKKRLDDLLTKKSVNQDSNNSSQRNSNRNIDKLNTILGATKQQHKLQLLPQKELLKINSEDPLMKFKMLRNRSRGAPHRR